MAYKDLKTLYYGNNENYAKEYMNRFNSEETIKLNFFIGEKQAFFIQNAEVWKIAFNIWIKKSEFYAALSQVLQ